MPSRRPFMAVHPDRIHYGNSRTDPDKVREIAEHFDEEKYIAPTGYYDGTQVILTDGNHRAQAAIQAGYSHVLFAPLTKEEYEHVAYSNRKVDVECYIPETLQVIQ